MLREPADDAGEPRAEALARGRPSFEGERERPLRNVLRFRLVTSEAPSEGLDPAGLREESVEGKVGVRVGGRAHVRILPPTAEAQRFFLETFGARRWLESAPAPGRIRPWLELTAE